MTYDDPRPAREARARDGVRPAQRHDISIFGGEDRRDDHDPARQARWEEKRAAAIKFQAKARAEREANGEEYIIPNDARMLPLTAPDHFEREGVVRTIHARPSGPPTRTDEDGNTVLDFGDFDPVRGRTVGKIEPTPEEQFATGLDALKNRMAAAAKRAMRAQES